MELGATTASNQPGWVRDTLRMEMGYPLYGHELSEGVLRWKPLGIFRGYGKIIPRAWELGFQKKEGVTCRNMAFAMTAKSPPPREGYTVWIGDEEIGVVTSGTQSPSLQTASAWRTLINPRQAWHRNRNRNSRPPFPGGTPQETFIPKNMSSIPDNLKYTASHEWIRIEGDAGWSASPITPSRAD